MSIQHLPSGPCWLHVVGPEGPDVLLADYDRGTNSVILVDEGLTQHAKPTRHVVVGNRVHLWTIFAAEPVTRPTPINSGYTKAPTSHAGMQDSRPVWRESDGRWVVATRLPLPDGVDIYADAWFGQLLIST